MTRVKLKEFTIQLDGQQCITSIDTYFADMDQKDN